MTIVDSAQEKKNGGVYRQFLRTHPHLRTTVLQFFLGCLIDITPTPLAKSM
jgi:hypothetical protein